MSEEHKALRKTMSTLRRELNMEFISVAPAWNKARRKETSGKRVGFFKPRFVKVGDEWRYARKHEGLTTDMDDPKSIGGNMSFTIIDPMSISRKVGQSKSRKYFAGLRKIHACAKTDKIVFELGLSKEEKLFLKRQAKAAKYAF